MEEKKVIKISLSTVLFIIALIIIVIMGFLIYKFYNDKIEAMKKSDELQSQVNSLTVTVTDLQGKISSISKTINSNVGNDNESSKKEESSSQSSKIEISKSNYSKYFGTWFDGNENEFTIRNIENDLITFTWFMYRTALIEDVTLPFKDNKTVFYYHGYDDKNYNNKNEDDEYYCRKAILELKENSISIKVENSTMSELNGNIELDKTVQFDGGVYIQPGQYNFTDKK